MAAVNELIRSEANGNISFGDYTRAQKAKLENYEHRGDLYKVKTCKEITKLEKNGLFVYESVPGTTVTDFMEGEASVTFQVEGTQDAQITLEQEADADYEVYVDGVSAGIMATNLGGKLSISVELEGKNSVSVRIEKR